LSLEWFRNRSDATVVIEQWRRHYNEERPHSSLAYLTPLAYKTQIKSGPITGDPASAVSQ
jgi:putative transposase